MLKPYNFLLALFVIVITWLTLAHPVSANVSTATFPAAKLALVKQGCFIPPEQFEEIHRLTTRIAAAGSLNDARKLALQPTEAALSALDKAHVFAPFSKDITAAHDRLSDARERLLAAASQKQVAEEFEGIMVAGLDNDRVAHVSIGSGGCDYSTGELIAIVVGLILGIIPGIILLVVLC